MSEEEYWGYITDFLNGYYGKAGESLLNYINFVQENLETIGKCMGWGGAPEEDIFISGKSVEINSVDTYPEDITAEMIRNYETVDWTQYWHWYRDITDKGYYLENADSFFESAYELAETDEERSRVEKAWLQVDYVRSYYLEKKFNAGKSSARSILTAYFKANPDEFTKEEQETLKNEVSIFAVSQARNEYANFNRNFYEKLVSHGVKYLNEGRPFSQLELNFAHSPSDWDD